MEAQVPDSCVMTSPSEFRWVPHDTYPQKTPFKLRSSGGYNCLHGTGHITWYPVGSERWTLSSINLYNSKKGIFSLTSSSLKEF